MSRVNRSPASKQLVQPFNRQIIQFEFSPTWSCVNDSCNICSWQQKSHHHRDTERMFLRICGTLAQVRSWVKYLCRWCRHTVWKTLSHHFIDLSGLHWNVSVNNYWDNVSLLMGHHNYYHLSIKELYMPLVKVAYTTLWYVDMQRWPNLDYSQSARYTDPMLVQCWPTVFDAGPKLNQHSLSVSCLLGYRWSYYMFGELCCLSSSSNINMNWLHIYRP